MTISYNWLCHYLPEAPAPEDLSRILTSIGLEVEKMDSRDKAKSKLKGLLVGHVLTCEKHPGADKLKVTTVSVGAGDPLQIVCGATNVEAGQKVVVAVPGCTLQPTTGEAFKIGKAKIRGVESFGMLCAEDEIGFGTGHDGIMVLPPETPVGTAVADVLIPDNDVIFEIGITPNRIDAMSHWGVARDVCAYLSHHSDNIHSPISPFPATFSMDNPGEATPEVRIEDIEGCRRYSGLLIKNVSVGKSPDWLIKRLESIEIKPVNNIVDVTNFILHETGQPLHAFDNDKIGGGKIIIRTAEAGSSFITLDKKERKLTSFDLMICDAEKPMCIAGVYGGLDSGVSDSTRNIFLESAWFAPERIRKTSLHHGLRTDAAARFEKGCDIGHTVEVLKRAALLIKEVAGGQLSGSIIDIHPKPEEKRRIHISFDYIKKLSGKEYGQDAITSIMSNLGFDILEKNPASLLLAVPFSKTDIHHPCDIVEEIMRIDGLDNIDMPSALSLSPSAFSVSGSFQAKEKIAGMLTTLGFHEILTNSIVNSRHVSGEKPVTMMNSLSSELDALRPQMLDSGVQALAFNLNRKNANLKFFEFGKTYHGTQPGTYTERWTLALWVTGAIHPSEWYEKETAADFYYLKGIIKNIFACTGLKEPEYVSSAIDTLESGALLIRDTHPLGRIGCVAQDILKRHDVKHQKIWYAEMDWDLLIKEIVPSITFAEMSKFPAVERDLALIMEKSISFAQVRETALKLKLSHLKSLHLFDFFESEKIGKNKKSLAVRFLFQDNQKTLTDTEVDKAMDSLISAFEQNIQAEIRK